jgi:hypothetical protein
LRLVLGASRQQEQFSRTTASIKNGGFGVTRLKVGIETTSRSMFKKGFGAQITVVKMKRIAA